ncbi:LicD family protein [Streptococcus suis]|nr:LicD family protein [Streptococcus suis]
MEANKINILQNYLLEMVEDILALCSSEGIQIFAVGGTLLGAVRYKGFIPWDDDFDFAIRRNDLKKLERLLEKSDKYDLHIPKKDLTGNNVRFPKIFKKNTILKQTNDDVLFEQRLFIDIFTIESVPDNILLRFIHGIQSDFFSLVGAYVFFTTDGKYLLNKKTKVMQIIIKIIGKIFGYKSYSFWNAKAFEIFGKYSEKNTKLVTLPGGAKHYFGEILLKSIFGKGEEINFCDTYILAPADSHTYLLNRYGADYMIPPSIEHQTNHGIIYLEIDGKEVIK